MTKTKGSLRSQRSIIEYTALIKTFLKMTTHPKVERLGNSFDVGRQSTSQTSGNLNIHPNKGEVGFWTLACECHGHGNFQDDFL